MSITLRPALRRPSIKPPDNSGPDRRPSRPTTMSSRPCSAITEPMAWPMRSATSTLNVVPTTPRMRGRKCPGPLHVLARGATASFRCVRSRAGPSQVFAFQARPRVSLSSVTPPLARTQFQAATRHQQSQHFRNPQIVATTRRELRPTHRPRCRRECRRPRADFLPTGRAMPLRIAGLRGAFLLHGLTALAHRHRP